MESKTIFIVAGETGEQLRVLAEPSVGGTCL